MASDERDIVEAAIRASDERDIVEAAIRLFRQLGFQKTTVADIARELRMSPANVYRIFGAKSEINEAVCMEILGKIEAEAGKIAVSRGTALQRMRNLVASVEKAFYKQYMLDRKLHELIEAAVTENWTTMRAHNHRMNLLLEQIIASGIASGEFPAGDTALAARLVNTACIRFCHPRLMAEYEQEPEPALDQMVGFCLAALAGPGYEACLEAAPDIEPRLPQHDLREAVDRKATKKTAKVGKAGSGVITSVRFDTRVRAAIDKAAKDDKRPTSTLIQIVMEEWLKAKGYLKAEIPAANEPPRDRVASSQITADLLSVIPNLRAFAVSLCGNLDRADDLVQETLVKAWGNIGTFVEGTNLRAWLFTILRNIYYSEYRKRRREVADPDGTFAAKLATAPAQSGHMDLLDFKAGSGVITSVRFDTCVRAAIDKAAKDDKRPTSTLIQIVMEEWLKAKGYLKAEPVITRER